MTLPGYRINLIKNIKHDTITVHQRSKPSRIFSISSGCRLVNFLTANPIKPAITITGIIIAKRNDYIKLNRT
ncbi:hypothetical protein [Spiroplasma kunkelii]|uniref:hypothetical protein n=1 Tax=Spiroplasma kunkelii TaxID=47834 RepID=UPI001F4881BC|nr:hypothetical protein [Spiroplasma kunkelii]